MKHHPKQESQAGVERPQPKVQHRFLDECGDTTFFGKGRVPVVGSEGVSLSFSIGMVKFNSELPSLRESVRELERKIISDPLLNALPSVRRKATAGGFFFHATDDAPEVRAEFFRWIRSVPCSFEIVVARKIPELFARKHDSKEAEFYADILSHLIKNKLKLGEKQVLNIAERGKCTRNQNLQLALTKATERFLKRQGIDDVASEVVFNVQTPRTEPLLSVADYFCWAVQRVFERGETRFYDYLGDQISLVIDLYDATKYARSLNYYRKGNPLTAGNKISPPAP